MECDFLLTGHAVIHFSKQQMLLSSFQQVSRYSATIPNNAFWQNLSGNQRVVFRLWTSLQNSCRPSPSLARDNLEFQKRFKFPQKVFLTPRQRNKTIGTRQCYSRFVFQAGSCVSMLWGLEEFLNTKLLKIGGNDTLVWKLCQGKIGERNFATDFVATILKMLH